jgi:hypothetical protein
LDVDVGDGRTLRVGLLVHPSGEARDVILAMGTGRGTGWREDPPEGLTLPVAALDGLVRVLLALQVARDDTAQPRASNGPEAPESA